MRRLRQSRLVSLHYVYQSLPFVNMDLLALGLWHTERQLKIHLILFFSVLYILTDCPLHYYQLNLSFRQCCYLREHAN